MDPTATEWRCAKLLPALELLPAQVLAVNFEHRVALCTFPLEETCQEGNSEQQG